MKSFYNIVFGLLVLSVLSLLSGCGNTVWQSPQGTNSLNLPQKQREKPAALTISAAASLKDALEELKQDYAMEKPNITLTINYGASGALQQQIEQGAPVDLFISAASKQIDTLEIKQLVLKDSRINLLGNKVVLVVPRKADGISDFKSLAGYSVKKLALGEPKSVPAGQYAEEVLKKVNIMDQIKSKIVYGNDVKQVLAWVKTGNADAGIVYETDAKASDRVRIAATAPEDSHEPVVYPAAVIKTSKNTDAAMEFMKFLTGEKAKTVFEKYGFSFIGK